jgi:hypothetical protein
LLLLLALYSIRLHANLIGYLYPIAIKVFTYHAASVVKAVMKYGKKPFVLDENKRDTYKHPLGSHEPSILSTFEGELKQLVVVRGNKLLVLCFGFPKWKADLTSAGL